MTVQNKNLVKSFGIATFGALLSVIIMFVTFGFKSGIEKQKIQTHGIQIIDLQEKKLNKETFIRFELVYKDNRQEIKKNLEEIKVLLNEMIRKNNKNK